MSSLPTARVIPLRGGPTLRWGILAPGEIADAFCEALRRHTDQPITAVGSRSAERAAAFAARHGIPHSSGSPNELFARVDVDIVYIAAPNPFHLPLALAAIDHGKHVLVEKPLALSATDGELLACRARAAGVFAGEAMWSRYLPQSDVVAQILARGDMGRVRLATAAVGWATDRDASSRFVDPDLGGGALYDAGVYALSFLQWVIGSPRVVLATSSPLPSGVDEQVAMVLRGRDGVVATASATLNGPGHAPATIVGERGRVQFLSSFVFPGAVVVDSGGNEDVWRDETGLAGRHGLAWQATAIAQFTSDGLIDSPVHPLREAVEVLRTMDLVRDLIRH